MRCHAIGNLAVTLLYLNRDLTLNAKAYAQQMSLAYRTHRSIPENTALATKHHTAIADTFKMLKGAAHNTVLVNPESRRKVEQRARNAFPLRSEWGGRRVGASIRERRVEQTMGSLSLHHSRRLTLRRAF